MLLWFKHSVSCRSDLQNKKQWGTRVLYSSYTYADTNSYSRTDTNSHSCSAYFYADSYLGAGSTHTHTYSYSYSYPNSGTVSGYNFPIRT